MFLRFSDLKLYLWELYNTVACDVINEKCNYLRYECCQFIYLFGIDCLQKAKENVLYTKNPEK